MDMKNLKTLTVVFGFSRIAYAAALIASPDHAAGPWLGAATTSGGGRVAARALAVRDGALGAGVVAAASTGNQAKPWLVACIASDIVDMTSTWLERDALPKRSGPATLVVAGAAAAAGVALAFAEDAARS